MRKSLLQKKILLIEELTSHNLKMISYFQSDITKYKLLIIVVKNYFEDNLITIEDTVNLLPQKISSRAHKLNCITDATIRNYFTKEIKASDQRIKYLKPSNELIEEFKEYCVIFDL